MNKEANEPRVPIGSVEVITSKVYGHHHDLVNRCGISVLQMTSDVFHMS